MGQVMHEKATVYNQTTTASVTDDYVQRHASANADACILWI